MKEGKLSGRVALVTGGSRGIGKAVRVAFGNEGASVAIHYNRGREPALEAVSEIEKGGAGYARFRRNSSHRVRETSSSLG
jgi:3-oxoacyl-[acyl-carrier protein] reductase